MSRRLILIRHAKSSWADTYANDHARQLNDRGVAAAKAMGQWLAQQGYVPDTIVTSDATRTLQTTSLLLRGMGAKPEVQEIAALYHAAPHTIFDVLKPLDSHTVALVGHNPGIAMAAEMLVQSPPAHDRFDDYPTCATTVLDFTDDAWCQPGQGQVVDFVVPADV